MTTTSAPFLRSAANDNAAVYTMLAGSGPHVNAPLRSTAIWTLVPLL